MHITEYYHHSLLHSNSANIEGGRLFLHHDGIGFYPKGRAISRLAKTHFITHPPVVCVDILAAHPLLGQKLAAVAHAGTDVCAPAEPGRFVVGLPLLESSFETFGNFRVLASEFFRLAYIVG